MSVFLGVLTLLALVLGAIDLGRRVARLVGRVLHMFRRGGAE